MAELAIESKMQPLWRGALGVTVCQLNGGWVKKDG